LSRSGRERAPSLFGRLPETERQAYSKPEKRRQ
jgi:hypothetical protein